MWRLGINVQHLPVFISPSFFFQIKSLTEPGTHGSARLTGQQTTQTLPPISTSPALGFQEQTTMPDVCTASTFQLSRLSSHPYLHSFLFDSFPGKCHYFGSPVHCYYCLFARAFWFQNKSGPDAGLSGSLHIVTFSSGVLNSVSDWAPDAPGVFTLGREVHNTPF